MVNGTIHGIQRGGWFPQPESMRFRRDSCYAKTEIMATSCDCTPENFPFFCNRHECEKTSHYHKLCRSRFEYFKLWEEGRGPGQQHGTLRRRRRASAQKSVQLVVARYHEDIRWLKRFLPLSSIVYDKGDPHGPDALPNVGREAHTYLHHIITHYDDLADITVFLQGDPYAHVPDLDEKIWMLEDDVQFLDLCDQLIVEDASGEPVHPGLPLGKMYECLFHRQAPEHFLCHAAACFAVSRENIRSRPRDFYEHAVKLVLEFELGPWAIERLWRLIFQQSSKTEGVVTAADAGFFADLQFLIRSVSQFNRRPLALFDLGLLPDQREWCLAQPGVTCLPIPAVQDTVGAIRRHRWWQTWLKPFYIFEAPFDRVLWIDADCIVLDDLSEAFQLIEKRPLISRDGTGAKTCNDNRLYERLSLGHAVSSESRDGMNLNAGVLGLCKIRDRSLLHTWAFGIQWAATHAESHPHIAWADQGLLVWALLRTGGADDIRQDLCWNYPSFEAGGLIASAAANRRTLLEEIQHRYPAAKIVHWFGIHKLSRQIQEEIQHAFADGFQKGGFSWRDCYKWLRNAIPGV
jgi:hypothetical protein